MSQFTKQDAISALNKALLPSSAAVHNPGELSEWVQLVHSLLGPGWNLDRYRMATFTSAVAATTIAGDTVPKGKYRHVLACHGVSLASPISKHFGLVVFDTITSLDAYIDHTQNHAPTATGFGAAYVGVTSVAPRPFFVPPLHAVAHNQTVADAGGQLMLRYLFADFDIGEPTYPA